MPAILTLLGVLIGLAGILKLGFWQYIDYGLRLFVEFFVVVAVEATVFIFGLLPADAVAALNDVSTAITMVTPYLDWADWAFNVYGAMTIVSAGLATAGAIRAFRWVIKVMPFVG